MMENLASTLGNVIGNLPNVADSLVQSNGGVAAQPTDKQVAEAMVPEPVVDLVKANNESVVNGYKNTIEQAIAFGQFSNEYGIPVEQLATFNAWRNGQLEVNDDNASSVISSLVSVASNGNIQDDYDGQLFGNFMKMTDDDKHELKSGIDVTVDKSGNAKRKFSREFVLDGLKKHFDALQAGEVGRRTITNQEVLKRNAGLNEGEDIFELPHERQMDIVKNLCPLYGDMTRFKVALDETMKMVGSGYSDCQNTEAGKYLSTQILKEARSDLVWNSDIIDDFLKSGQERTEENLAKWLSEHRRDSAYETALKTNADPDTLAATAIADTTKSAVKDELIGVQDKDGKWHLQYKNGGKSDADFVLKNKVLADLADADGRYNAIRAIEILNENPMAWSFYSRWVRDMTGEVSEADRMVENEGNFVKNRLTSPYRGFLRGDKQGMFNTMMDYISVGKRVSPDEYEARKRTCFAALGAFSCIDRRTGSYSNGNDSVGRVVAGVKNAIEGGAIDFFRNVPSNLVNMGDTLSDWASKLTGNEKSEAEIVGKSLSEGLALANSNTFFSDNTVLGEAAEFLISLEAMGGLFGASKKLVGGSILGAGKVASKLSKITSSPAVGMKLAEGGAFAEKMGKWLAVGGKSERQIAWGKKLDKLNAEKISIDAVGGKVGYTEQMTARIEKLDKMIAEVTNSPEQFLTLTEDIAQFVSKIPAGAYFYEGAKRNAMGTYVLSADDVSDETLNDMATHSEIGGVIEGVMMAGITHLAKGNKSIASAAINSLREEAKQLDRRLEQIIAGTVVPMGKDATAGLGRRLALTRAFDLAKKSFAGNAEFMFTMEEAKVINENWRLVTEQKMKDPTYQPTVYDWVGRGQADALAETAKIASTSAISSLIAGGAKTAIQGVGAKTRESIASSRATALMSRISTDMKMSKRKANKYVTDLLSEYYQADKKGRKDIRSKVREQLGEEKTRLFDQLVYELDTVRTVDNALLGAKLKLRGEQKLDKDSISSSLSSIGVKDAKVDAMPNGSTYITIPKGTKVGGYELDADRKFVVKASDLEGMHYKEVEGKKVYDLNWIDEVIEKHENGEDFGEFSQKLQEKLDGFETDGERNDLITKLKAGEDVDGLLELADKCAKSNGIFIPKGDERFAKSMQDEDVDLVDGVILLANAKTATGTPMAGLNEIIDAAVRRGANVETFLHEYFHAITDCLPFTPEQLAVLNENFGVEKDADGNVVKTKNWKEGLVEDFLKFHTSENAAERFEYMKKLNNGGVLDTVIDSARNFCKAFGVNFERKFHEDKFLDGEREQTLNEYVENIINGANNEVKDKNDNAETADIASEIVGGKFSVSPKNTRGIISSFRKDVRNSGGFADGKEKTKHLRWVNGVARGWIDGTIDLDRYPKSVVSGFSKKDSVLCKSLCVASLNGTNDSEFSSGLTSANSLFMRSGMTQAEIVPFLMQNGVSVKGLKGYDPATCVTVGGGSGYVRLNDLAITALHEYARDEQKKNIVKFARQNGIYFDGIEDYAKRKDIKLTELSKKNEEREGMESVVWRDTRHGNVVKHLARYEQLEANDLSILLDRVVLFNSIFPESRINVTGWGEEMHTSPADGKTMEKCFGLYLEQPYFEGALELTEKEVDAYMKKRGFNSYFDSITGQSIYVSNDNSVVVKDINKGNAIRLPDGSVRVIDAICALNTKQNEIDDVVPSSDVVQGFKSGTYNAVWQVKGADTGIIDQIADEKRRIGATEIPVTGKPYVAIGSMYDKNYVVKRNDKNFVYDTKVTFNNPIVSYDAKIDEKFENDARARGYDGIILLSADGSERYDRFDGDVKSIGSCVYENGKLVDFNAAFNRADWNVVGQRSLIGIIGDDAAKYAKIARTAFKEAFDAIGDEHCEATLRDRKRRIDNVEINEWLASRGKNDISVELGNGIVIPMKFYKGGADGRVRYEYSGKGAKIPYGFNNVINGDNSVVFTLADFFKNDELLNNPKLAELLAHKVYVKGTQAYSIARLERDKGEAERVKDNPSSRKRPFDPMFVDNVGINEFGDVVIEHPMTDNRTLRSRINTALVKAMQKYEGWEEPVTYSREYFGEVLSKRQQSGSPFVFDVADARLLNMVRDVVRERMKQIQRGREIRLLDTDIDAKVDEVSDALLGTINECAKYFASEIEARNLGERFGVDVSKLGKYTDFQKEVVGGFVKAWNRNGLFAYDHTRNVLNFYRKVVSDIAARTMSDARSGGFMEGLTDEIENEINVKIRDMFYREAKHAVANMGKIEERVVMRENLSSAKEYSGRMRGEGAETIVAEQSNVGKVEGRMSEETEKSWLRGARQMIDELLANGGQEAFLRDGNALIPKMIADIKERMGSDADYYTEDDFVGYCRNITLRSLEAYNKRKGLYNIKTSDGVIMDGGLKDENTRLRRENKRLSKRVENAVRNRIQSTKIRNAVGMSAEEVDSLFGNRDTIGDLIKLGDKNAALDAKAPILDHDKFSNDMTVNFICEFRDANPEFKKMPVSELFSNPVAAAEFSATVSSWLDRAARKCAYGRVRDAVRRDVHALRWMVKPSFFTAKNILTDSVRKMVELQKRTRVNDIIDRAKKTIDKRAMGKKAVVQNQEIYDRDVLPLVQEYWKEVKDCMELSQETVDKKIIELQAKYGFGDEEWNQIRGGEGSKGLESLTEDQLRDRRKALIRATALTRYGALKSKSLGEIGDKVDELARDIATHVDRMNEAMTQRLERDRLDVDALVGDLTSARAKTTGASNLDISKKRSMFRGALYHNVPDLFLKMGMYFAEGSKSKELCHELRRDFSLAHIDQEQMISRANEQFMATIRGLYGGREFGEIITELMTPVAEYAKFSRQDWGFNADSQTVTVEIDGKKYEVKKASVGADPNATRAKEGLSKAQLMYIYAACTQDDMRVNNVVYGRDAQYFRDIIKEIGPEGLAVVKWMREQYDLQRRAMSPICESLTGMPIVSPDSNYFKLKFEQARSDPMEKRTRFSPNLFPSFLKERTNHDKSRLEEKVDIFRRFYDSIQDTAHYCAFMPIIDRVRTTFCDSKVQTAYAKTIGSEAYNEMYKQLTTALNGGNYDSVKWLAALRNFTTANTLFYNLPSALKQFEGVGGWSCEMGVTHWLSDLVKFNFGSKVARENAAAIDTVLVTRKEEGYSDVARALKESIDLIESGKGKLRSVYEKYKKHGLKLTELIDNVASRSMAGAYFNQKFAYYRDLGKSVTEANRLALADVDYAIQTTQQSSRPEFQNAAQRGDSWAGELGRIMSQFAGPSYVRLGMELEAMHRYIMTKNDGTATKEQLKDARRNFVSKLVALHFVCPSILTALECIGGYVTHNPDDDDFLAECSRKWARNVLTGPFSGMFVLGSLIEGAVGKIILRQDGQMKVFSGTPLQSKLESLVRKTSSMTDELGAYMDDLDGEALLNATLDVINAILPPMKHATNAVKNIAD